jgi:beta-lactamase superfamily II metal-dependent hydrolase
VRRLDWLAITHADLDHIGGAVSVARAFRPREVWEGTPVPSDPERDALRRATASGGLILASGSPVNFEPITH